MRHLLLKGEAPCIMNYCIDNPGGVKQSDQVGRTQHAEGDDEQEKVMDATRNRHLQVPAAGGRLDVWASPQIASRKQQRPPSLCDGVDELVERDRPRNG